MRLAHVALAPVPPSGSLWRLYRPSLGSLAQTLCSPPTPSVEPAGGARRVRWARSTTSGDQIVQQPSRIQIVGTDGSWPASRSARSTSASRARAWTATRGGERRWGVPERKAARRARAFCDPAPPDVQLEHRSSLWACRPLGGETPPAGVRPHRGAPPARPRVARRAASPSRRRRRTWCGWRCGPGRRPRARAHARERGLAGERGGEGVDEERGRVLSLGLERAERARWTWPSR